MLLSYPARLMFIGTWTFADDNGNLEAHPKMIKALIFPGDKIKVEPLIAELIEHKFLIPYALNGKEYLHIRTFKKHQKINRPSPALCPVYEDSLNHQGGLSESSCPEGSSIGICSGSGKESIGRETEGMRKGDTGGGETKSATSITKNKDSCPSPLSLYLNATGTDQEQQRRKELKAQAERLKQEGRF